MALEEKLPDGRPENAAERLADLTGRDRDEFDASDYEIPDFENQELVTAESEE